MSQEAMMLIAVVTVLMFMWAAFTMHPRTVHESAFIDCPQAAAKTQVYVMLCISVEGNLRAVQPDTKALLAEMPVAEFPYDCFRDSFAASIAEGLRNLYSVDVNPIFYTTPLAHNVLPRNIMDYPALDMHIRTTKRLVDCKVFD